MSTNLLNPACDVCGSCDCVLPVVMCEQDTVEGVREVNWTVDGADTAWIVKTCPSYPDPVETTIPITLTDGAASGTISPADPLCIYRIYAENACGEVSSACFLGCADYDCDEVATACECLEMPSGQVRAWGFSIPLVVSGIVRGRTFTVLGFGTFTTPDIDVTGTYWFNFTKVDEGFGCFLVSNPEYVVYEQYLYTHPSAGDVYAQVVVTPGIVGSRYRYTNPSFSPLEIEYWSLFLQFYYPCGATGGTCLCPTGSLTRWQYEAPVFDPAFSSFEVTAYGISI